MAPYLHDAITSILAQSYSDFDLIVLDDGSTDTSVEIVSKFAKEDTRIHLHQNQKNLGIIESRNILFDVSDHELWAIMDSDDICEPKRFEKQIEFLDANPDICIVASDINTIPINEPVYFSSMNSRLRERMIFNNILNNPSCMVRSLPVKKHHIRYDPDVRGASDYKFWLELMQYCNAYILDDVLLHYRRHGHQESTAKLQRQRDNACRVSAYFLRKLSDFEDDELVAQLIWPTNYEYDTGIDALIAFVKELLDANLSKQIYNQDMLRSELLRRLFTRIKFHENSEGMGMFLRLLRLHDLWKDHHLIKKIVIKLLNAKTPVDQLPPILQAKLLMQRLDRLECDVITLYGAGHISDGFLQINSRRKVPYEIETMFDMKAKEKAYTYKGVKVMDPEAIVHTDAKTVVIASYKFKEDVIKDMRRILGDNYDNYRFITL